MPARPRARDRKRVPPRAALTPADSSWRRLGAAAVRSRRRSGNALDLRPGLVRRVQVGAQQRPDLVAVVCELLGGAHVLVAGTVVETDVDDGLEPAGPVAHHADPL